MSVLLNQSIRQKRAEKIIEAIKMLPILKNFDQLREEEKKNIFLKKEILSKEEKTDLKDKFSLVLMVFYLYGLTSSFSWQIFITANDFFVNYKLNTPISTGSYYQLNFSFITGLIWQFGFIFTTAFNLINCDRKFNQNDRIPYALVTASIAIGSLISICIIDSKTWSNSFFICLCLIIFIVSASNGLIFSSAIYVASMFPQKYIAAIIIGFMTSGLVSNIVNIVTKAVLINKTLIAIFFFVITFGLLLVSFIAHFSLPLSSYYKYHVELGKENILTNLKDKIIYMPYVKTFKRLWPLYFSVWILMFTTMCFYSGYQQKIKSITKDFIIPQKWFTDLTSNLTFDISFLIGCLLAYFLKKPSIKWVLVVSFLKAILTCVFFILCNYEPNKRRKYIPIYIQDDYLYWSGCFMIHLISGFLINCLMMFTPKEIKLKYKYSAALLSAFTFIFGIVSGVQFNRVLELVMAIV